MKAHISTSIIIPTYNRCEDLENTLNVLLQNIASYPEVEIIVVDNGSTDDTHDVIKNIYLKKSPRISYYLEENNGLHNARHLGAKRSNSEILIYIDDDVSVTEEWLPSLLDPFEDSEIAVVGGRVEPSWGGPVPDWVKMFHPGYLSLLDLGDKFLYLSWPESVYGCNMAVRRSVLFEVGGFNPDGFAEPGLKWYRGDGETGLVQKIYEAGYSVCYQPEARLYHRISSSRLTPSYFLKRTKNQAFSDGFTAMRRRLFPDRHKLSGSRKEYERTGKSEKILKLICNLIRARVWLLSKLIYYWFRGVYFLHYYLDKDLRYHLRRDNYLD